MKKILYLLPLLCATAFLTRGQTPQQLRNIQAFNKIYGYVRFFHPSDEASRVSWNEFAVYGCDKVLLANNDTELQSVLLELFLPIAPAMSLGGKNLTADHALMKCIPPSLDGYDVTWWQHLGVALGERSNIYKSIRTNRGAQPLFEQWFTFGEHLNKEIGSMRMILPIAVYANKHHTYPIADSTRLASLMLSVQSLKPSRQAETLGAVVVTWNIFQHFYPYFETVKTDWNESFVVAAKESFGATADAELILKRLTATAKDGHVSVRSATRNSSTHALPFSWEWVEGKLVVTDVQADTLGLAIGDVVTQIDAIDTKVYFDKNINPYISAASPVWLKYRSAQEGIVGKQGSSVNLTVLKTDGAHKNVAVSRTLPVAQYYSNIKARRSSEKMSDETYYLNLSSSPLSDIEKRLPDLQQAKNIICDLRGYPNSNHAFLQYLMTERDTSSQWMQVPHIVYPDREKISRYAKGAWRLSPKTPRISARIFFLINGKAISYSESLLSFVEHYKLGTLIGEPTAGTNGNTNVFTVPGGYTISFTGMRVLKHNGSQHHGVGIIPNVLVSRSVEGIRAGRDEVLEKAIELSLK